jgi:hypothetical protein
MCSVPHEGWIESWSTRSTTARNGRSVVGVRQAKCSSGIGSAVIAAVSAADEPRPAK